MTSTVVGKFWNDKKIVKIFKEVPVQKYWVKYFSSIKNRERKRVLDVGCGAGRYTEMLAKMGFQVYAFDQHEKMVEETAKRIGNLENLKFQPVILKAGMTRIPFQESTFDIVLSNGVFHNAINFSELQNVLKETARVTKPNGKLCLNMFYDSASNTSLKKTREKYVFTTRDGLPMTLATLEKLIALLEEHGFKKLRKVVAYSRRLDVGRRDVVRGIFKRT